MFVTRPRATADTQPAPPERVESRLLPYPVPESLKAAAESLNKLASACTAMSETDRADDKVCFEALSRLCNSLAITVLREGLLPALAEYLRFQHDARTPERLFDSPVHRAYVDYCNREGCPLLQSEHFKPLHTILLTDSFAPRRTNVPETRDEFDLWLEKSLEAASKDRALLHPIIECCRDEIRVCDSRARIGVVAPSRAQAIVAAARCEVGSRVQFVDDPALLVRPLDLVLSLGFKLWVTEPSIRFIPDDPEPFNENDYWEGLSPRQQWTADRHSPFLGPLL